MTGHALGTVARWMAVALVPAVVLALALVLVFVLATFLGETVWLIDVALRLVLIAGLAGWAAAEVAAALAPSRSVTAAAYSVAVLVAGYCAVAWSGLTGGQWLLWLPLAAGLAGGAVGLWRTYAWNGVD